MTRKQSQLLTRRKEKINIHDKQTKKNGIKRKRLKQKNGVNMLIIKFMQKIQSYNNNIII